MTLESLLAQFDVMAEAPDGVQRLRKLVLQLAVQGKLVAQGPGDEPAAVLMARVLRERASEAATKGVSELTSPVPEVECPHEVPLGWEWWPFAAVARIASNLVDPRGYESGAHIAPDSIEKGTGRLLGYRTVGEDKVRSGKHRFYAGQLLYSKIRPALSKATIVDFDGLCSADMYPLDVYIDTRFLLIYMLSATFLGMAVRSDTRVAMPKINQAELSQIPVPVPPLAEQCRIVAKVDELMALCEELEARQQRRVQARERANRAVLQQLTAATDDAELAIAWERLRENFELLYDVPGTVSELRQVVLQLGVTGKLVSQGESVEPVVAPEIPGLPTGWRQAALGTLAEVVGGIQKQPKRRPVAHHFPYLRVANVQRGRLDLRELERFELSQAELDKWRLRDGDLLIVEGNGSESEIGRCAVWRGEVPDCVHQNHLIRVRPSGALASDFVVHFLNSPQGVAEMKRLAVTTSGLFNLSVSKIVGIQVPVPPLAMQHLIVAKVNELMAFCDRLEAHLNQARYRATHLAAAVVHRLTAA